MIYLVMLLIFGAASEIRSNNEAYTKCIADICISLPEDSIGYNVTSSILTYLSILKLLPLPP